jgi:flagellar hook-length control protein FliK
MDLPVILLQSPTTASTGATSPISPISVQTPARATGPVGGLALQGRGSEQVFAMLIAQLGEEEEADVRKDHSVSTGTPFPSDISSLVAGATVGAIPPLTATIIEGTQNSPTQDIAEESTRSMRGEAANLILMPSARLAIFAGTEPLPGISPIVAKSQSVANVPAVNESTMHRIVNPSVEPSDEGIAATGKSRPPVLLTSVSTKLLPAISPEPGPSGENATLVLPARIGQGDYAESSSFPASSEKIHASPAEGMVSPGSSMADSEFLNHKHENLDDSVNAFMVRERSTDLLSTEQSQIITEFSISTTPGQTSGRVQETTEPPKPATTAQVVQDAPAITSSRETLSLHLDPPELGRLIMQVTVQAHQVQATVGVQHPGLGEFLIANHGALSNALLHHGMRMEELNVETIPMADAGTGRTDLLGHGQRQQDSLPSQHEPDLLARVMHQERPTDEAPRENHLEGFAALQRINLFA